MPTDGGQLGPNVWEVSELSILLLTIPQMVSALPLVILPVSSAAGTEPVTHFLKGVAKRTADSTFVLGLSLENSGFFQLCRKVMEWLSDDTTHFHYSL